MIQLTVDERQTLERWQRSTTISAKRARRGLMLLLLAAQVPVSHIATIVGCTRHDIYKWAQRFLTSGLAGLADKRRMRHPKRHKGADGRNAPSALGRLAEGAPSACGGLQPGSSGTRAGDRMFIPCIDVNRRREDHAMPGSCVADACRLLAW